MKPMLALSVLGLCALASCGPRITRQMAWWHNYGQFHGCAVIGARETEFVGRRGYVHERAQTCYRCVGDAVTYCFEGRPIGPPEVVAAPVPPPGAPPGPPPGPPPPPP